MRNDMAITKISNKVNELSKRKKDGKVIEYKSTKLQKPIMKKIKREKIADEVRNENKTLEYKDPVIIKIEQKENELNDELKEQEQAGIIVKASHI